MKYPKSMPTDTMSQELQAAIKNIEDNINKSDLAANPNNPENNFIKKAQNMFNAIDNHFKQTQKVRNDASNALMASKLPQHQIASRQIKAYNSESIEIQATAKALAKIQKAMLRTANSILASPNDPKISPEIAPRPSSKMQGDKHAKEVNKVLISITGNAKPALSANYKTSDSKGNDLSDTAKVEMTKFSENFIEAQNAQSKARHNSNIANSLEQFAATQNSYLEMQFYQDAQKAAWVAKNPKATEPPSASEYSKMTTSDMDKLHINGVVLNKTGNSFSFAPDALVQNSDGTTHQLSVEDTIKSMVVLLQALKAEGCTKFTCTSNNKASRDAFRLALKVANIKPGDARIFKQDKINDTIKEVPVTYAGATTTQKITEFTGKALGSAFKSLLTTPLKLVALPVHLATTIISAPLKERLEGMTGANQREDNIAKDKRLDDLHTKYDDDLAKEKLKEQAPPPSDDNSGPRNGPGMG